MTRQAGRTALACLVLLLPACLPPAAAQAGPQADFASPAQVQGGLGLQGAEWALLVFHQAPSASFGLRLAAGATATNVTVVEATGHGLHVPSPLPARTASFPLPIAGTLGFSAHSWASLFVRARSISLSAEQGWGVLDPTSADDKAPARLPPNDAPRETTNMAGWGSLALERDGVVLGVRALQAAAPAAFSLRAEGVSYVEWHNATLDCPADGCPDPGRPGSVPLGPDGSTTLRRLSYIQVRAADGSLQGSGQAWALALGGPSVEVAVDGRVRLPDARLVGTCPPHPCPDPAGRTLLADGQVVLSGLAGHADDPSRLRATLGGAIAAAFDESPVQAFGLPSQVGLGVLALAGAGLLAKALVGLFARSSRPPALQHPRRRALFELVRAEPGLSFRSVQRRLGWPTGTLSHHVQRLLDEKILAAHPYRNTVRLFDDHGRHKRTWREELPLRDPDLLGLLEWLHQNPAATQVAVARQAGSWGWSRSKTRRRLLDLQEAGLLDACRQGRTLRYTARRGRSWPAEGAVPA